jgi:hypothetical protein
MSGVKRWGNEVSLPTLVKQVGSYHGCLFLDPVIPDVRKEKADIRENGDRDGMAQQCLFEVDRKHVKLGYFYELATAGFYGGEVGHVVNISNGYDDFSDGDVSDDAYPDVYDRVHKKFFEAKGNYSSYFLKLEDDQIERYQRLLEKMPDHELFYAIYRHSIGKSRSFDGSDDDLFARLANETYCGVVLPFSIVEKFHESRNRDLVYRYDETVKQNWNTPYHTRILPGALNRLLKAPDSEGPEEVLRKLCLDPNDYLIERGLSPARFSVNCQNVRSFPIVRITEKNSIAKQVRDISPEDDPVPF